MHPQAAQAAAQARAADLMRVQAESKLLEWLHAIDRAGNVQPARAAGSPAPLATAVADVTRSGLLERRRIASLFWLFTYDLGFR